MRQIGVAHNLLKRMLAFLCIGISLAVSGEERMQLSQNLVPVASSSLCVTEGRVEEVQPTQFSVNSPKMRAYLNRRSSDALELRFTYLGVTSTQVALASGASRQQFGLKLRAQDACNLVYVMWRVEPREELVVSVKRNVSQHSSMECGNHGYQTIHPRFIAPLPPLGQGQAHRLRATMRGEQLDVFVDNMLSWQGPLGPEAVALQGPVGLRSDNTHLDFQLAIEKPSGPTPDFASRCKTRAEVSE